VRFRLFVLRSLFFKLRRPLVHACLLSGQFGFTSIPDEQRQIRDRRVPFSGDGFLATKCFRFAEAALLGGF